MLSQIPEWPALPNLPKRPPAGHPFARLTTGVNGKKQPRSGTPSGACSAADLSHGHPPVPEPESSQGNRHPLSDAYNHMRHVCFCNDIFGVWLIQPICHYNNWVIEPGLPYWAEFFDH